MKKGLLSKLAIGFVALFGVFAMSSCEQANHSAVIPTEQCEVRVVADQQTGKKTAVVTLGIANPTIYNITEVELSYDCYQNGSPTPIFSGTDKVAVFVRHGVGGYLSYTLSENQYPNLASVDYVRFTQNKVTGYQTLWETYLVPFICAIVIVGIDLIFFAFQIFRGGWTKEYLKQNMREKLASTLTIFALMLIICLVPLMFSNWVTTLILLGAFLSSILLNGLMTLIKMSTVK